MRHTTYYILHTTYYILYTIYYTLYTTYYILYYNMIYDRSETGPLDARAPQQQQDEEVVDVPRRTGRDARGDLPLRHQQPGQQRLVEDHGAEAGPVELLRHLARRREDALEHLAGARRLRRAAGVVRRQDLDSFVSVRVDLVQEGPENAAQRRRRGRRRPAAVLDEARRQHDEVLNSSIPVIINMMCHDDDDDDYYHHHHGHYQ